MMSKQRPSRSTQFVFFLEGGTPRRFWRVGGLMQLMVQSPCCVRSTGSQRRRSCSGREPNFFPPCNMSFSVSRPSVVPNYGCASRCVGTKFSVTSGLRTRFNYPGVRDLLLREADRRGKREKVFSASIHCRTAATSGRATSWILYEFSTPSSPSARAPHLPPLSVILK